MKKRMFSSLILVILFTFMLTFVAQGVDIRISTCNSDTHPQNMGLQIFKTIIENETDHAVKIYGNSQLGGERESIEKVQNGMLEMATASAGPMSPFNNKIMVLDIPFAFNNYETAWMVMDGPMGKKLLESFESSGMVGLGYLENGFRHVTNSKRPINVPEDLNNLKIRTMEAPNHMANFKELGANPTPVPWPELYTTLQQKIVDGQENPLMNIYEVKIYEVNDYASLTKHIYDPMTLVANKDWFDEFTEEEKQLIKTAALRAQNYSRAINYAREKELIEILESEGMEVNEISKENLDKFRQMSQPYVIDIIEEEIGEEFVQNWLTEIEKAESDIQVGLE